MKTNVIMCTTINFYVRVALIALSSMFCYSLNAQKAQLEKLSEIKDVQYQHFDKDAMKHAMDNDFDIQLGDFSFTDSGKGDILKGLDEIYVLTTEAKSAGKKLSKGARKILKGSDDDETVFVILKGTVDMSKLTNGMISNLM